MGHVEPWLRALVTSSVGPGSPPSCRAGAALSCAHAWVAVGARPSSLRRWSQLLVCHWHTQPGTLPRREPVPGRGQYCFQSCDVVWTEAWGIQRLVTSPGARVPSPLMGLAYAPCPSVPSTLIVSPLALLSLLLFAFVRWSQHSSCICSGGFQGPSHGQEPARAGPFLPLRQASCVYPGGSPGPGPVTEMLSRRLGSAGLGTGAGEWVGQACEVHVLVRTAWSWPLSRG